MADTSYIDINPLDELVKAIGVVHGEAEAYRWRRLVNEVERQRAVLADESNTYMEGW